MKNLLEREQNGEYVDGCVLLGPVSIPKYLWYGTAFGYRALVMDLLGPSLADVLKLCNPGLPRFLRRFNLRTVAVIGVQAVKVLQSIHSLGYVHRDIKPANFLMYNEARLNRLYLIDFGLAKAYNDGVHIKQTQGKGFSVGTPQFASLNAHNGLGLSRRDDIEALGYMLVFFAKGLPWVQRSRPHGGRHRGGIDVAFSAILLNKKSTPIETLCEGLPQAYADFLLHARSLSFEAKPDYDMLVNALRSTIDDYDGEWDPSKIVCDWNIREVNDGTRYTGSSQSSYVGSKASND